MKQKRWLLLLLCLSLSSAWAQKKTSAQQEVEKTVVLFFDALTEADMPKLRQTCTDDFLLLEDGEVWNLDTLQAKLAGGRPADFKRVNRFDFFSTDVRGDVAWMAYENTAVISRGQRERTIRWLESAVLEKTKRGWRLRVLHSTVIRDKP